MFNFLVYHILDQRGCVRTITWRSVHDEKSSKINHTRISFVMIPRQIIREAILHDERKASRMFSEKQPIVSVT